MANHCASDLGFLNFICESTAMAVKVSRDFPRMKINPILSGNRFEFFVITCDDQFLFENLMFNDITFVIPSEEEEKEEETCE